MTTEEKINQIGKMLADVQFQQVVIKNQIMEIRKLILHPELHELERS